MSLVITMAGSFADKNHVPVVAALRKAGHEVRDYRSDNSFRLRADPPWSFARFVAAHQVPEARERYAVDRAAAETSDVTVLLLAPPHSGRSSHWEAGYAAALGRPVIVYVSSEGAAPETVYTGAAAIVDSIPDLLAALDRIGADAHVVRSAKRTRVS